MKEFTDEQKQKLIYALNLIKETCRKVKVCEKCPFIDKDGLCKVSRGGWRAPVNWNINTESKWKPFKE